MAITISLVLLHIVDTRHFIKLAFPPQERSMASYKRDAGANRDALFGGAGGGGGNSKGFDTFAYMLSS
jgi:hypothetical protein